MNRSQLKPSVGKWGQMEWKERGASGREGHIAQGKQKGGDGMLTKAEGIGSKGKGGGKTERKERQNK